MPDPAVVIVTHDTRDEALGCLGSIDPSDVAEVVLVDSGSSDDTVSVVRSLHPAVRVVALANAGFARSANAGIRATSAEVVVVCNADVRFAPAALSTLAAVLDDEPGLAAVGPLVHYPDGTVQASARSVPDTRTAVLHGLFGRLAPDNAATRRYHGRDRPPDEPRDVDWLSGCALALRRSAVEAIGGFDPGYFLYVEDVDLGERLRDAGWRLRFVPHAEVTHRVGASTSRARLRALRAHARSLERHQVRRRSGPQGPVLRSGSRVARRVGLRVALVGWVVTTWLVERMTRGRRSVTGERLVGSRQEPPAAYRRRPNPDRNTNPAR